MKAEQILEDVLEEVRTSGVSITQHPNGTKILKMGSGQLVIFPYVGKWKLQFSLIGQSPNVETEYSHEDIEKMVLRILRWGWSNGAKLG